jgi:predicted GNAT family acetyltransferase
MITTVAFGKDLAWIGNVVVDKRFRGKHIGQSLVEHAIMHLRSSAVRRIGLYCFSNNVGFYEKLGFIKNVEFKRLRRRPKTTPPIICSNRAPITLRQIMEIDRRSFGADRSKLLRALIRTGHGTFLGFRCEKSAAYLMTKNYRDMYEFGPGVAVDLPEAEMASLLRLAVSRAFRKPIELSCLAKNYYVLRLLKNQGFEVINTGYRMFLNRRTGLGDDRANYLLGFKDKG